MSGQDGLLSNPRDLFLRPHLFIVHSGADEADLALARSIAQQCESFTRPQYGTLAKLKQISFFRRVFPGITFLILSPAMLAGPEQRAALAAHMQYAYQQKLYQHYCVCRDVTAEELRAYPELELLLDNVMAGDAERHLPAILADLHGFATRVLPASPELEKPVSVMFYTRGLRRTLAGLALALHMLVGWFLPLALPAAAALAVFWWQGWKPWGTETLVVFTAFYAGFRLNHLQSSDMWPWLGNCWKQPHNKIVNARRPPKTSRLAIGPLSLAGLVIAAGYARASDWFDAGICAWLGFMFQSFLDLANSWRLFKSFTIGAEAERALPLSETVDAFRTRLTSLAMFRAAGGVLAIFYGGLLLTLPLSALLLAPAILAAPTVIAHPAAWISAAAVGGYLLPALLERFAHSGIAYLGEYNGLSSAPGSVDKKLAGTPNTKLSPRGVQASERPLIGAFAPAEQPFVLQWLNSLRIGLRAETFRRWLPAPDYAFVSYAWRDDSEGSIASATAAACKAAGIECFLDKITLQSREGMFRMPIATGLSKCTHMFLVVTPNIASGQVVRREIEMAMGRWRREMLPAIVCVVEPRVRDQLVADPAIPLPIRFLLTFCPQMTPAEAAQPALVRYIAEFTRRQGKWADWRLLLSPSTALSQVMRLPGIFQPEAEQPSAGEGGAAR